MANSDVEVAVIGGGAAGIGAARRLSEAGVKARVIEARNRLGGRAWTVEAGGSAIDLGCGWLHSAARNPWTKIAETQGRTIDRTPAPWARAASQPGLTAAESTAFRTALWALHERADALPDSEPDRSLADLLEPGGRWNALLDAVSGYYSGAALEHRRRGQLACRRRLRCDDRRPWRRPRRRLRLRRHAHRPWWATHSRRDDARRVRSRRCDRHPAERADRR